MSYGLLPNDVRPQPEEQIAASVWYLAVVRALWNMQINCVLKVCSLHATCDARQSFKAIRDALVCTIQMRTHLAHL